MADRLVAFFKQPPVDLSAADWGRSNRQWLQAAINDLLPIVGFYFADVAPAIRARRRTSRGDVLSRLIESDYSTVDILVECITYGTAGMVTTREFISIVCWYLLTHSELNREYTRSDHARRLQILEEIMRLEPVVGHLYRRAQKDLAITDGGETFTSPAGDLIDVRVRQTNTDTAAVGSSPEEIFSSRSHENSGLRAGLSFSDGAHKCPGQSLTL